jgi:hypothetical protein
MASKRYRGQTCAYCATPGAATTADHVFARKFFPIEHRNGLPKVPACAACNNAKSGLEHYLTAVLPFAARHAEALSALSEMVPPRLAANQKLAAELRAGQDYAVRQIDGRLVRVMTLPFDSERLMELFAYIARGLAFHDFKIVIPKDHVVRAGLMHPVGEAFLEQLFRLNGVRTQGALGAGVFKYSGMQGVQDPHLTIWKFRVMGGLQTSGDPHHPDLSPEVIWATTSKTPSPLHL